MLDLFTQPQWRSPLPFGVHRVPDGIGRKVVWQAAFQVSIAFRRSPRSRLELADKKLLIVPDVSIAFRRSPRSRPLEALLL